MQTNWKQLSPSKLQLAFLSNEAEFLRDIRRQSAQTRLKTRSLRQGCVKENKPVAFFERILLVHTSDNNHCEEATSKPGELLFNTFGVRKVPPWMNCCSLSIRVCGCNVPRKPVSCFFITCQWTLFVREQFRHYISLCQSPDHSLSWQYFYPDG